MAEADPLSVIRALNANPQNLPFAAYRCTIFAPAGRILDETYKALT
jgi:hypothetical protein